MIPVTKPYLPSREKLNSYIDGIYERNWLTNNGPLVQELTRRLEVYLGVENLLLLSNGTLALQIAYRTLGVSDSNRDNNPEAITTPFTFIATASSLKWEGVQPVFADIDPATWCLDPANIEAAITPNTRAIVPVHVFGNACDVEAIDAIAKKNNLKVIYDAAHAFGVTYKNESLLKHGDAATLSFHATKLFHTVEGGAIVFKRKEDLERAKKIINFGIAGPETIEELGINAKMNELQAAMGLCVLDEMENIKHSRQNIWEAYDKALNGRVVRQRRSIGATNNHAYFPLVLKDEPELLRVTVALLKQNIQARRYFYPSLESVAPLEAFSDLPISKALASRVLCLPLYSGLDVDTVLSGIEPYLLQPEIQDLSTWPDRQLVGFIKEMDQFFKPSIASRTDLTQYVQKLKTYGILLGTLDANQNVTALFGFYANDLNTRTAVSTYLAVKPELRGRNIAKSIFQQGMTLSALRGMKKSRLVTWSENEGALKLYRNLGFKEIKREDSVGRINVIMEADL